MPMPGSMAPIFSAPVAASGVSFNNSDKQSSDITVSNSDLTAAFTNDGNPQGIRSKTAHATGKYHLKFRCDSLVANYLQVGFAGAAHALNLFAGLDPTHPTVSCGWSSHHFLYYNGGAVNSGTVGTDIVALDTGALELDLDNGIWRIKNVTNASAWTADQSLAGIFGLPWYFFACTWASGGGQVTLLPTDLTGATSGFGAF